VAKGAGAGYQFVSSVRAGIGGLLDGASGVVRIALEGADAVARTVETYRAEHASGLDARAVLRTVPRAGTTDFEPNLFPCVELAHAALPWMLSPASPPPLRPWIVLVVVEDRDGVTFERLANGRELLRIDAPAVPATELPDLRDSWAWAHAQEAGGDARARLVAPRRLVPDKKFVACIVPAFAGSEPAWTGTEASVSLPVYFSWRFATGPGGDFASLVKLVTAQPLAANAGGRRVDVSRPGWGVADVAGASVELTGMLRSPGWQPPSPDPGVAAVGRGILAQIEAAAGSPLLAPPMYGAAATRWDGSASPPPWQTTLSADVVQRIAAGLGASVVRANLDSFVEAAWHAAGVAERANQEIRQAELAAAVTGRLARRHIGGLSDDGEVLAVARPLLARMHELDNRRPLEARLRKHTPPGGPTLAAAVRASAMPDAALAASFRRLGRPAGPLARVRPPLKTGAITALVDAQRIAPVPSKRLAPGAVAFDDVSAEAHERPRLHLATPQAVENAAAGWKSPARRARRSDRAAERRVTENPEDVGVWIPEPISEAPPTPEQIDEFVEAAKAHQQYIVTRLEKIRDTPAPSLARPGRPLSALRATISRQWEPDRGVVRLLGSRLDGVERAAVEGLQPIRVASALDDPLLRALSPEHVLPALEGLPANCATVAATAPELVRAFLVGANDELGRELLWRGLPTVLGHTWLKTFWGRVARDAHGAPVATPDIDDIERWPAEGPSPPPEMLMLVVRADVLHRYPSAVVYAIEGRWDGAHRVPGDGPELVPVVAATLGADVALFGFDLTAAAARGSASPPGPAGWYFVIAEHPHEPRFGLAASATRKPRSWQDVAWSDVADDDLRGNYLRLDGPLARLQLADARALRWGGDSAQMAAITFRRSIRVARHAATLLPPEPA
jgi:hypothetical protein